MPAPAASNLPAVAAWAPVIGALLVTEELALQQLGRDGGAVDRHKGPTGARALLVHETRQHLLARPALSLQEKRNLRVHHLAQRAHDLLHGRAGCHEPLLQYFLALPATGVTASHAQPIRQGHDVVVVEGLLQIVHRPQLHGMHRRVHRGVGSDDDHRGAGLLQIRQELGAVQVGKLQVHERAVEPLRLCAAPRFRAARGGGHAVAFQGEGLLQTQAHPFLVIDDEEGKIAPAHASSFFGNHSVTVVPTSGSPEASIEPPCCFMIVWLRARPRPVP